MPSSIFATPNSRWVTGPDKWILTSVPEVYGVWNLANYHSAYFLAYHNHLAARLTDAVRMAVVCIYRL